MKAGDKVAWVSQAQGCWKKKKRYSNCRHSSRKECKTAHSGQCKEKSFKS